MPEVSAVWTEVIWCALVMATAVMYGVWLIERRYTYLAFIGSAPVCLALGILANFLPVGVGYRVAINALLLMAATLSATEGFARRAGRRVVPFSTLLPAIVGVAGVFVLAVTHRSLRWEVRLQDCTTVIVVTAGIYHGRLLTNRRRGDRLLGLILVAAAVYFATRSWLGLDSAALCSGRHSSFDVFTPPFVVFFVGIIVSIVATLTVQEVRTVIETLRHERDTDVLTGALNRRGFRARVDQLLAVPGHTASSFVIFDLDKFKPINDRYGHTAGDDLLRRFCALLRAAVRASDVVGRLGGDEFAIYLPGLAYRDALAIAERIRAQLARTRLHHLPGTESMTVSFGIATTVHTMTFEDLLSAADVRLYEAKKTKNPTAPMRQNGSGVQ
jgi:diguanylate cyclase (GGDEF)-like protein